MPGPAILDLKDRTKTGSGHLNSQPVQYLTRPKNFFNFPRTFLRGVEKIFE
jgi:hypothetical protein